MSLRKIVGGVIAVPSMFGMRLIWISGAILHFYTAVIAYSLAGPGEFWGFFVGGAAFAFPFLAEIVVFIAVWNATGLFINGFSIWLLLWLGFAGLLFGLVLLGGWLASSD